MYGLKDSHPVCALHKALLVLFCCIPGRAQRISMLLLDLLQLGLQMHNLLGQLACRLSMRLLQTSCIPTSLVHSARHAVS